MILEAFTKRCTEPQQHAVSPPINCQPNGNNCCISGVTSVWFVGRLLFCFVFFSWLPSFGSSVNNTGSFGRSRWITKDEPWIVFFWDIKILVLILRVNMLKADTLIFCSKKWVTKRTTTKSVINFFICLVLITCTKAILYTSSLIFNSSHLYPIPAQ